MSRLIRLAAVALALAACVGPPSAGTPGPLPSPLALPTVSPIPFPTAFPEPTEVPTATISNVTAAPTATLPPFPFEVEPDEPARGPADAAVTIIQYGDFQGQYDALFEPALRQVLADHPDEVRLVWRPFPLMTVNDKAYYAAVAAEAARRQGKFWEMHDLLFDNYLDWSTLKPDEFWPMLDSFAADIDLDREQLAEDLVDGDVLQAVVDYNRQALAVGVPGTPALIINRTPYTGPLEHSVLERTVRLELLKPKQYAQYPDTLIDPLGRYSAILHTVKGDIEMELFAREAPVAVNNFVFLAGEGWYDGNTFYRVEPGLAAYTGDPSDSGLGGPGYLFADEIAPTLLFDGPGVVALDNAGADTNGSRFFITFTPLPQFDGLYTIIGRVTSGLGVISRLTPRDPAADPDAPPGDVLDSVVVSGQ